MKTKNSFINKGVIFATTIALALVSCRPTQEDRPPSIESNGGGGWFYDGKKEEITVDDVQTPEPQGFQIDTVCPGALDSRLKIGDFAQVIIYQLKARSMPGFSSYSEHVLAEGRTVEIINGPTCEDSAWWWYIHFSGTVSTGDYLDFYAWMVEVDYDTYYLQRIN